MNVVDCLIQRSHSLQRQSFLPIFLLGLRSLLDAELVCCSGTSIYLDVILPQTALRASDLASGIYVCKLAPRSLKDSAHDLEAQKLVRAKSLPGKTGDNRTFFTWQGLEPHEYVGCSFQFSIVAYRQALEISDTMLPEKKEAHIRVITTATIQCYYYFEIMRITVSVMCQGTCQEFVQSSIVSK